MAAASISWSTPARRRLRCAKATRPGSASIRAERDYTASASQPPTASCARGGTELNRVEVGGVTVRNVAALILPDEALGQNLLGMTFLSKLRWEQKNGKLILEQ